MEGDLPGDEETVEILPVTAENLEKLELDRSTDINLSLPITSTYLRRMRQRPEPCEEAGGEQTGEQDEVRCRHHSYSQSITYTTQTLMGLSQY